VKEKMFSKNTHFCGKEKQKRDKASKNSDQIREKDDKKGGVARGTGRTVGQAL
jgi:hypothetical protein